MNTENTTAFSELENQVLAVVAGNFDVALSKLSLTTDLHNIEWNLNSLRCYTLLGSLERVFEVHCRNVEDGSITKMFTDMNQPCTIEMMVEMVKNKRQEVIPAF